ncbi:MAG: efflux RND transporter periplasmic adaptor subunit [Pseudoxanthomonas suwonensis]|nr:efflux RND transporter periplasmic adaptor subunit [Pseudoxanthomonas suwonensis]
MAIRDTSAQDIPASPAAIARHRRRAPLLIAAAALMMLVLLAWVGRGWLSGSRSVSAERVRIAEVVRGDLVRDISADGRIIAANSPSLYAIGAGTVTLKVVAGDVVKAGDVLAEIDSPELLSRLAQEQASLASLQAEASRATLSARLARSNARKLLDQARIEQTAAQRELERYQRAYEGGAVAQVDLARARDALERAQIGTSHASEDAGLQGAAAGMDARNRQAMAARQQAVVEELQRQVDALAIRAPFDGQVGQVFVAQQQNVQANAAVLSVVDLSRFEVEIKVPESFARDLSIGVPAQLTANNRTHEATVAAVSPEVVNGEVSARLRFADGQQPPELRQNQRMSARILLDTRRDVLMVERGPALDAGTSAAWVVVDGVASRRPVEVGAASLNAIEIRSGLQQGERVLVSGAEDFGTDERVRIH